jgi:hypothetical protein
LTLARIYLWMGLVSSVVFGGAYLVAPEFVTQFSGIEHTSAAGLTDLRATYAGFQLGMAALLGWCLRDPTRYGAGLVAFACVVGGLGLTRLLGLVLDGPSLEMVIATLFEFAITGFALFTRARLSREAGTMA